MQHHENPINQQLAVVNPKGTDIAIANKDSAALAAIFGNLVGRELHNFTGTPRELWQFKSIC